MKKKEILFFSIVVELLASKEENRSSNIVCGRVNFPSHTIVGRVISFQISKAVEVPYCSVTKNKNSWHSPFPVLKRVGSSIFWRLKLSNKIKC